MKNWKIFITFISLLSIILGNLHSANAQHNLAQQAYAIFERNCLNCHGEHGAFTEEIIIEHTALIETGAVVPGKPIESELYKRLLTNDPAKRMPLGQPQLPPAAILTIGNWIQAGAPDWQMPERDTDFITPTEMLETIEKHVNSLSPFDRAFTRYFTITHLYNAGESAEALHAYQRALSKLVNSLSWGREVIKPQPIDPEETIFYIDLRDYEWEIGTNRWTQIEQVYPYRIEFDAPTQTHLRKKLTDLREEMNCEVPFVHVDWFIATASLPPLYHDILDLPQTDHELETRLEVNVVENIRNAAGRRVWRAGFNNSGVSSNNRVVERHISRYGAYWKSYDFAGNVGTQNVFTHPLSFRPDGGEIIFNLPNGLQAYYLVDAGGNRLDAAPIKIVRNPAASDPTVRNGLSCIGCHTEGMKVFEDEVRGVVEQNANPPFNKDRALRLYAGKAKMDELLEEDTARYRQALEKTGDVFGGIEPVQRFHEAFQRPIDAAHASAAVGLETGNLLEKVRENANLKNLGLGVLTSARGGVKRDTWTSNFNEIVVTLNSPDSTIVKPVIPRTERIPGESVHIPDANLRAAIAETLGKLPGVAITAEDLATLTFFDAFEMDIQSLEGLQFATNLEEISLHDNPISDLSPLSGLTTLKEVRLTGKSFSDLSPLAGLINLEGVGFWKTSVADLSPLAGLTKLRWLQFSNTPISDLSPLAGLTSLKRLEIYAAKDLDLLPLKGLTNLVKLKANSNGVLDVSPLSGLINLESLDLVNGGISDISSLASLKNLKELKLQRNRISDVSPLAGLHNLEKLQLHWNKISDFSPLDGLRENTKISWFGNPGFPQGGPKIEGPWLWVLVPGTGFWDGVDLLSQASDGAVTELGIATRGATEETPVGENVWTSHKIAPAGEDNIGTMLSAMDMKENDNTKNVIYGSLTLYSPREQQTQVFAGSYIVHKVWLNGEFVHENLNWWVWAREYQDYAPVTLKQGTNVLLVAVHNSGGEFNGYFGFEPGTEYTVVSPGTGFAFSADTTSVRVGDTFTVHVNAEKVTDLAGWQFNLTFDPTVLEAIEVKEGGFLKKGGGTTFFQKGAIDNATGKITGLSSALISKGGVTGTGKLVSVVFSAKAVGNGQVTLHDFRFGSNTGEVIPAGMRDLIITVASQPLWDVNADGQVSILDLILVAQHMGSVASATSKVDVNRDGVVSILDLILVAQHMGESTSAASPSILTADSVSELDPAVIQAWIEQAQLEDDGSIAFQQGIANLQRLLALLIPEETLLLANYPNPFNPETWIPYHLANPSNVRITIYNTHGSIVRRLDLGHQREGYYTSRSRAAYWDSRNAVGERVASGVYFYQLQADHLSLLRKMLIVK
ncbi:MAG: leucine-rich repeat domain-containing protein [Candidatus Poribacteria bacterium]|nr:leucine-rich repeat domain-containing protein [Candidatus Poribacteria bacterium]